MPVNGSSCLFPYFILSRSCQLLLAKCHFPCLGLLNLQAFLYLFLILSVNDGIFGRHSKDSAKAVAFTGSQKDQCSWPGSKVPAGHDTPSSSSRPEDARWGSLHKSQFPPPPKPPKEEAVGGWALGHFSLL